MFVEKSNEERRVVLMDLKQKERDSVIAEERLRTLNVKITEKMNDIAKNQDLLASYNKNKAFILSLAHPASVQLYNEKKQRMREQIKRSWVARVQHDTWMDDVIFGFEDIFPDSTNVVEAASICMQQPNQKN
jgi:hypothetical protein